MKALGVGLMIRKAAAAFKPVVTIQNYGYNWTFKVTSTIKSSETNATEGLEFSETTLDGRQSKSLVKRDGDRLVHEQRDAKTNDLTTTVIREIVGGKFVQTLTAGPVVCKRIYVRA